MTVIAANSPEIADAMLDLETGLAVARLIYTHYFERTGEGAKLYFQNSREDIAAALGAVIDYIRSAQVTLEAIESEEADRKETSPHTTE